MVFLLVFCCLPQTWSQSLQFLGQEPYTAYVSRGARPGYVFYRFFTEIVSDSVTYSLVQSDPDELFAISASGELSLRTWLPLSNLDYHLVVQARSPGAAGADANITISSVSQSQTRPIFEHNSFTAVVVENRPSNTLVTVIRAFSLDPYSTDTARSYSIFGGNQNCAFSIDSQTGVLSTATLLDREQQASYTLTIRYTDSAGYVEIHVQVSILDVNDNAPTLSEALYVFNVSEAVPPNSIIGSVLVTDFDSGANGQFSYTLSGPSTSDISITTDGQLIIQHSLDYEQQELYRVDVMVTDMGMPSLNSSAVVLVNVLNIDDECPLFSSLVYAKEIPFPNLSSPPPIGVVLTVTAFDPDKLTAVTYTIISGNDAGFFTIDVNSGDISLVDNSGSIRGQNLLNVTASDLNCHNTSSISVVINIGITNNHQPILNTATCVGTLVENSPPDQVVTTLVANDGDFGPGGDVEYAIVNSVGQFELFTVNPKTGEIKTVESTTEYDREETAGYKIGVTATDGGFRQDFCLIDIQLIDENDNTPLFEVPVYTASIRRSAQAGDEVMQVLAYDPDQGSNGMVDYSVSMQSECPFTISTTTGSITVTGTISATVTNCQLTLTATDQGNVPRSSTALMNITIFDSSVILPMFDQSQYNVTIPENYPVLPSIVTTISTINSNNAIYKISQGSLYRFNSGLTFIVTTSGTIYVDSGASLVDFERLFPGPYYFRLLITATSNDGFSVVPVIVHVTDENDNPPRFPVSATSVSIREDEMVPSFVSVVQAMDIDNGQNSVIVYSTTSDIFGVNSFNGTITTKVVFDASIIDTQMVNIGGSNGGPPINQIQVTVNVKGVNDQPPSFIGAPYVFNISETHLIHTKIGNLSAMDNDLEQNLIFTITTGNSDGTFQTMAPNGQTGALILNQRLDYETTMVYSLQVEVSDGEYSSSALVTINVLNVDDEPPIFAQSSYHASITENAPPGTSVLKISATDSDTSQVQYQLSGPALGRLSVNNSGVISVSGNIDREEFLPDGRMSFLAFAIGGPISTTTIIIDIADINDETPKLTESPFIGAVPENTDPGIDGLFAVKVTAVDKDAGSNGDIVYSLLSGGDDGFKIDSTSGIVTAHQRFDREARQFYKLTVQATDQGMPTSRSSTADIIVEISDYNDNPPMWVFSYMYARVFPDAMIGSVVFKLQATDPDNMNNASIVFLSTSNPEVPFSLNSTTGDVLVSEALNNLQTRQFSIDVSIHDNGNPLLNGSVVGVLVIDILDTPIFSESYHHIPSLLEDTRLGTIIYSLNASGIDSGSLSYSIISGNTDQAFSISSGTDGIASVRVASSLDYETTPSYVLTIKAQEDAYPSLSSTATLNISIADVNDNAPVFSEKDYRMSILENSEAETSVIQVSATDPDSDNIPGGRVSLYELVSSQLPFQIDPSSGLISTLNSFDREALSQPFFTLAVIAVDNDPVNPQTGTATVVVNIEDVNDNPSSNGGHFNVIISARDGLFPASILGEVYFSDPDDQDMFQNCILLEGDESIFMVNLANCSLTLTQANPEAGVYSLIVQGNDGMHSSVNTTVTVQVSHFTPIPILLDSLIIFTLNSSGSYYLDNIGSKSLLDNLTSVLQHQVLNVSVQQGIQDSDRTIDVAIVAIDSSGGYEDPTFISQELYTARNDVQFGSVGLYSIATDPCITEPCLNRGQCRTNKVIGQSTNRIASRQTVLFSPRVDITYQCMCQLGTVGDRCETNYDDCFSSPCQNGGTCIDGLQDYTCQCPSGTSGKDCNININECESEPCQNGAICTNGFGAPVCDCLPGYYGNLCQYSHFLVSKHCDASPCQNGGSCSQGRDTFNCRCPVGFSGKTCTDRIDIQGGCLSEPCYNGSECIVTANITRCECSIGFTGPLCRFPLNNCELKPCQNGGTCETGLYGSYICVCLPGFTGQNCTDSVPVCTSSSCHNGGTCNEAADGTYTCSCPREFTGDLCQTFLNPPDRCLAGVCNITTTSNCTSSQDGYSCSCKSGFSGNDCSLNNPPSLMCDSNPCQHGATCNDISLSAYSCSCPSGFTGSNCETNINDCSDSTPCRNGGTCVDGVNGFLCSCAEEYGGRLCEVHCPLGQTGDRCQNDINYCTDTACQNGGTCIEEPGNFSCQCQPRFKGLVCNISNGCDNTVCLNQGTCMDSVEHGHVCQCPMGGPRCELLTVSFQGNTTLPSYRAFRSLTASDQLAIQFEFATLDSNGLLLLNTQYQQGESRDIISAEIVNNQLRILFSLGSDDKANITVLSSSLNISDGQFHTVEINILQKVCNPYRATNCELRILFNREYLFSWTTAPH